VNQENIQKLQYIGLVAANRYNMQGRVPRTTDPARGVEAEKAIELSRGKQLHFCNGSYVLIA
jgi:hypothetical protein